MAFLSTDDLSKMVIDNMGGIMEQGSALVAAGVSNISYDTTHIQKIDVPYAAVVAEGTTKPVQNPEWELEEVKSFKLVHAMVVTEEFEDSDEGREKAAEAIGAYLGTFAPSADITIINGTNPRTGNAVGSYSAVNLKDNAAQFTSGDAALTDRVIQAAAYSVENPEFVLLSQPGLSQLGQLVTEPNGLPKINGISRKAAFDLPGGFPAQMFKSVGRNSKSIANTNLAVLGDFSKIGISFERPTIRVGREGIIGGENLLEENKIAYIVEMKGKFYIDEPSKNFAVVKNTAA